MPSKFSGSPIIKGASTALTEIYIDMDHDLAVDKKITKTESDISKRVLELWQEIGKETKLDLSGMSMLPLINDGDSVVIRHTRQDVRAGYIVAFKKDQKIIVHRVIRIENENVKTTFLTKGDFNLKPDRPFHEDMLIGRVIAIIKRGAPDKSRYQFLVSYRSYCIYLFFYFKPKLSYLSISNFKIL